jgi:hypothetical protein
MSLTSRIALATWSAEKFPPGCPIGYGSRLNDDTVPGGIGRQFPGCSI